MKRALVGLTIRKATLDDVDAMLGLTQAGAPPGSNRPPVRPVADARETFQQIDADPRTALTRGWYDARLAAWNASASLLQRSPLWPRRHPRLSA